ncbi:MAG: type I methionyl aminopeptidase [Candidatus Latescibacteria bacterium 4484_7]|nr:MAG: type I methionyl aminopeptidase [Candidatus Latescibacteria bacterium 4484_7]RKZ09124.1 MAG: type I methionyl aminopeptidase [bacterium]
MIIIKSKPELDLMRESGEILRDCFEAIEPMLRPGVTTGEIDRAAEEFIRSKGALPAFKGYQGYPATVCASVNEEVVHGIPGPRELREGDIIGVDMGVLYREYYSDASRTYPIGKVSEEAAKLIRVTKEALDLAIDKVRPGNHLSDISNVIQTHAEINGYSVVRVLVGHGVGRMLHEEPQVPNFGPPGRGPILKPGMVIAIEPMLNEGTFEVIVQKDRWTYVTADRRLSAHFEDTVAVTEEGHKILTR